MLTPPPNAIATYLRTMDLVERDLAGWVASRGGNSAVPVGVSDDDLQKCREVRQWLDSLTTPI